MNPSLLSMLLVALVLAGCATGVSKPSRYYVLPSLADRADEAAPMVADGPSLGVLEIDLPAYLDRPQLVVRDHAAGVQVREFARWAGALKSEIQRVLSEDLAVLLGSARVHRRPWPSGIRPRIQLAVAIDRFDVDRDGVVRLYAAWQLIDTKDRHLLAQRRERIQMPPVHGEAAMVAAQGEALAELARRVARRFKAIPVPR